MLSANIVLSAPTPCCRRTLPYGKKKISKARYGPHNVRFCQFYCQSVSKKIVVALLLDRPLLGLSKEQSSCITIVHDILVSGQGAEIRGLQKDLVIYLGTYSSVEKWVKGTRIFFIFLQKKTPFGIK